MVELDGVRVGGGDTGGDGPALVLLPGLGGTWRYWYRVARAMGRSFRLVCLDLPGFGDSSATVAEWGLQACGDVLAEAWSALGIERPVLVGHSLGGSIAIDFASRRRDEVAGVALLAPAGLSATSRKEIVRAEVLLPISSGALRVLHRWETAMDTEIGRWIIFRAMFADPAALDREDAIMLLRGAALARQAAAAARLILRVDLRAETATVQVPVMGVWGARDAIVTPSDGEVLTRLLPAAEVHLLPGVGHMPMLEAPDELAALLAAFADQLVGSHG